MPTRRVDTTIRRTRIGYTDRDGQGSCYAWVSQFHNALMQVRDIAWDGRRWFVAPKPGARFEPVGEDEVPKHEKERFAQAALPKDDAPERFGDKQGG